MKRSRVGGTARSVKNYYYDCYHYYCGCGYYDRRYCYEYYDDDADDGCYDHDYEHHDHYDYGYYYDGYDYDYSYYFGYC